MKSKEVEGKLFRTKWAKMIFWGNKVLKRKIDYLETLQDAQISKQNAFF